MIIHCDRNALSEAIAVVSRAVASKAVLAVLEGVYIKAAGKTISLTGYNLDIGISTSFEGDIEKEGEIVLNARLLLDIVKRMPEDKVTIDVNEKHLANLSSGASKYTLLGVAPEEFPQLPDVSDTENVTLSQATLKEIIGQISFAISVSEDKPVHTGALFEIEDGVLTCVAVDGFRLALRREEIEYTGKLRFVVPRTALLEMARILKEDKEKKMQLMVSRKHIACTIDAYLVVARLLEGDFLDYNAAIPKSATTTVIVSNGKMIDSIERTSLLISDRLRSPIRVHFKENTVDISCATALGKASDTITGEIQGDKVEMGFNHKYLLDALKASHCSGSIMEITGPLSPMKILPATPDCDYLFLVLPVRLKNE